MTTTIYDGNCVICNSTRLMVTALDWLNRVEFLDLHNRDEVERRYPWLDYEKSMGAIHVVDSEDAIYEGYFGVRRMLRDLPLGLPLWALLHLPGTTHLGKRAYGWVARHRYQINKLLGVDLEELDAIENRAQQNKQGDSTCEDGVCKIPY